MNPIHSHFRKLLAASAALVLACHSTQAFVTNVTETFDTGLGRFDAAVGNTSNGNNFGFSNSTNAGGTGGEIGGTFSQGATAYVADTTLNGTLTKADPLVIKAKAYSLNGGNDQSAGLGYFTYTGNNADASRGNLMAGIVFFQGASYSRGLLVVNGDWGAPFQLTHDTFDIDLALRYDPGEDKLYLEGTVDGQSVSRYTWYSTMTRTADAFGVISAYGNGGAPSATAYFDNLQYSTVYLPPGTVTETFDTGLGRFDAAVGNTSSGNNFGFTNSSNAGGAAGEIGGTFSQGAPAYVADTTLGGTLTKADPLIIRAKAYSLNGGNDQHAGLGYFTYTGNNTDASRENLMAGIVFIQGASYSRGFLVVNGDWGAPFQLSHNTFDIDLRLRHDPGEDKLYLEGTVDGQSVSRYTWYSTMTRTANAFGVNSAYGNGGEPSATAYFDNLQYFAGYPPTFTSDPVVKPNGERGQAYSGTLTDVAVDPQGDPLTFAKVNGPNWLVVASNGTLSGTPGAGDVGTNTWTVSVTDGTATNTAMLIIAVGGPPQFLADPIVKATAKVGVDYSVAAATLATSAADPLNDPLTFAKVNGPTWLVVASNGTLSGTPGAGDVGTNSWTVSVTDGSYTNQATLRIAVVGAGSPITITGTEDWDGVQNPRAGEGVTLVPGSGTEADPAVYTIPATLALTATSLIRMSPDASADRSITFRFTGGNLQMDNGAVINVARRTRTGRQAATLDIGGGSITGAGQITGLFGSTDTPRVIVITNAGDIYLKTIDVHVENVSNWGRHMSITASNRVEIGTIDNSDWDTGGESAGDVSLSANTLTVSNIFTYAMRTNVPAANGGAVVLKALGPPGYNPADGEANTYGNKLMARGIIQTHTNLDVGGAVTLQAVQLQLDSGFNLVMESGGSTNLHAGVYPNGVGATAADMFVNHSVLVGLTPNYDVQWGGGFPPTSPVLAINKAGTNVVLSWSGSGYTLQRNTNLTSSTGWVDLPGTSPVTNGIESGARFYRLKR